MPKKISPNSVRIRNRKAEFLTFAYQTGGDGVEVRVQDGTIWPSQKNIGLLFETTPENVLMHLKKIYAENELTELATANEFLAVQSEGSRRGRVREIPLNPGQALPKRFRHLRGAGAT